MSKSTESVTVFSEDSKVHGNFCRRLCGRYAPHYRPGLVTTCLLVVAGCIFQFLVGSWIHGSGVVLYSLYQAKQQGGRRVMPPECLELPALADHPSLEVYDAFTKDGVKLSLWRLRPPLLQAKGLSLKPVLLVAGMECSSRDWFVGLGGENLPWALWRAGFDVWLGNNRGTFLSHTQRWDWTFESMADFDFPALVSKVLALTAAKSLAYVGHSQGSLQAFMHLAVNSTLAQSVSHMVALAPVVFWTQRSFTWNALTSSFLGGSFERLAPGAGPGTSFAFYELVARAKCELMCSVCTNDVGGSNSMESGVVNSHDVPERALAAGSVLAPRCQDKFKCIPAGTSSDNVRAYAEALRLGSFQAYLAARGRPIDFAALAGLPMSVTLVVGSEDLFVSVSDVRKTAGLWRVEGSLQAPLVIEVPDAGHMDLLWGVDAPRKIFAPIIERLKV